MSKLRLALILLVLPAAAFAQGIEGWITQALDTRTSPSERIQKIDQVIKEGGAEALAARGLNPELAPEVVHMVVDRLLATGNGKAHIEAIIRLLLSEKHEANVARRLQETAQERSRGEELKEALDPFAVPDVTHKAHKDEVLRVAAIRALRQIPQRAAVRTIVAAWLADESRAVKAACKQALQSVLVADTAEAARNYLNDPRWSSLTYRDLVDEVIKDLRERNRRLQQFQEAGIKHADAGQCLQVLETGELSARKSAAERLTALAKEGAYGAPGAEDFAKRCYLAFTREIARGEPVAVAALIETLKVLVNGGDKAPLRGETLEALFLALPPLATRKGWTEVGLASVDLLATLGVPAGVPLVVFARDSGDVRVRKVAVNRLASLARRTPDVANFMASKLVELIETEKEATVRGAILFELKSVPIEAALNPIRTLLEGKLSSDEFEYCIEILRKLESEESLATLLQEAGKQRPDEALRLFAIKEGLLQRRAAPAEEKKILAAVEAMALDETETATLRSAIVAALGERGGAAAYDALQRLAASPAQKQAATAATLSLANRLAKEPKAGVETAARAVHDRIGGDAEALDKLAVEILKTCDKAKRGAGAVRYHRAMIYAGRPDAKRAELLQRYRDAAARAADDNLSAKLHVQLCEQYRALLEKGARGKDELQEAINCLVQMSLLLTDEKATAAQHLVSATLLAAEIKDRAQADKLYADATAKGAAEADLARAKAEIEKLPKPS